MGRFGFVLLLHRFGGLSAKTVTRVLASLGEVIVKKDQFISECEQSFQKMGLDFYEVMKKAPEVVERWKKYYPLAQEVWSNARSPRV